MSPQTRAGDGHELLTVDVWDTLLRRRCHPDSVKLHVCRFLLFNFRDLLSPERRDPWLLLRLRQQAEKDLGDSARAQGLDDEYRHRDVYDRWLELSGLDLTSRPDLERERILDALEEIELAQEKYVSYVDPSIAATLAGYSAAKRHFLSDFYLPAAAINELLGHHGISSLLEGGTVSCEVGLNKRSGRLFRHMHERLAVAPDRHLHVGDNPVADIRAAQALGINTVHYLPEAEHRRRLKREKEFHSRGDALRSAINDLMAIAPADPRSHREAYDYGRRCSLLLVGFLVDAMERATTEQVARVYFFTREGEFFLDIYRRLAELDLLGFPPPPAELLHVSRLATFAGSLRDFSASELMRLWNQYSVQSLHAFLVSLGLSPEFFAATAARHGIAPCEPIRYPWQDERVVAFLADPEVRQPIMTHLAEQKRRLLAYLASRGLSPQSHRFGIVDIGWRGTIQDNLAHLLPTVDFHGHYLALNRFLNVQPSNARKTAFGPDLNLSSDGATLLDFVAPVEMLCNSPNGSVIGYEATGEGILVHRHVDAAENEIHESCTRHFQAGVLSAVPFWADFLRTHAYSADEIRPVAMEIWSSIIQQPPAFLAQAYFRLNHNETFGVGGFADKRQLPLTSDLLLALVSPRHRARVRQFLKEIGWLPGLLAREDLDPSFRRVLRWLLKGIAARQRLRTLLHRGG